MPFLRMVDACQKLRPLVRFRDRQIMHEIGSPIGKGVRALRSKRGQAACKVRHAFCCKRFKEKREVPVGLGRISINLHGAPSVRPTGIAGSGARIGTLAWRRIV
nr:hypothetical protein VO57_12630 [Citromicrobium sp. JL2201]